MKKPFFIFFSLVLALFAAYFYLNGRCTAFGYDNIVISKELFCAKSTVSEEYQYEATKFTPLRELEGNARDYKPIPTPIPKLEVKNT